MARYYPHNKIQMQGKSIGQVYTSDAKKARGNNALIAGMCHVNDHTSFVFFDCVITQSFVSIECMKHFGLKAIPLSPLMVVTTVMDNVVETPLICENCSWSVNGRVFQINFISLSLKKVDIVLGLGWISADLVFIGCEEKLIIITSSEATLKDVLTYFVKSDPHKTWESIHIRQRFYGAQMKKLFY